MGHTPFGYRIENGIAVIDEAAAGKLRMLYDNYLGGMALTEAARQAGIDAYHASVKRLLMTERVKRAAALGRLDRKSKRKPPKIPTQFSIGAIMEHYDNPATQAEYVYSLLNSEVV